MYRLNMAGIIFKYYYSLRLKKVSLKYVIKSLNGADIFF